MIRWRARYEERGLAGLDDRERSGRPRELDHCQIMAETLKPSPKKLGVTHWSSRLLGERLKISNTSVARAWRASWTNMVEVWFGLVEPQAVRRGVFKSVPYLNARLRAYIEGWDKQAHPFVWTKTAEDILKKANRSTASNPRH